VYEAADHILLASSQAFALARLRGARAFRRIWRCSSGWWAMIQRIYLFLLKAAWPLWAMGFAILSLIERYHKQYMIAVFIPGTQYLFRRCALALCAIGLRSGVGSKERMGAINPLFTSLFWVLGLFGLGLGGF
jgi:uncharacterized membrane protein YraQ (UPF0718 family)